MVSIVVYIVEICLSMFFDIVESSWSFEVISLATVNVDRNVVAEVVRLVSKRELLVPTVDIFVGVPVKRKKPIANLNA